VTTRTKPNSIETVIAHDRDTIARLSEWTRARGKERREASWFRRRQPGRPIAESDPQ
jgi:hypothetical protein